MGRVIFSKGIVTVGKYKLIYRRIFVAISREIC